MNMKFRPQDVELFEDLMGYWGSNKTETLKTCIRLAHAITIGGKRNEAQ